MVRGVVVAVTVEEDGGRTRRLGQSLGRIRDRRGTNCVGEEIGNAGG